MAMGLIQVMEDTMVEETMATEAEIMAMEEEIMAMEAEIMAMDLLLVGVITIQREEETMEVDRGPTQHLRAAQAVLRGYQF